METTAITSEASAVDSSLLEQPQNIFSQDRDDSSEADSIEIEDKDSLDQENSLEIEEDEFIEDLEQEIVESAELKDEEDLEIQNAELNSEAEINDQAEVVKPEITERKMKLRNFQYQLFRHSLNRNSIVYLPTGTGKTRVAISSMFYYLSKFGTSKKIVFLANTVQLVKQQTEAIRRTMLSIFAHPDTSRDLRANLGENYISLNWDAKTINTHICCIHGEKNDQIGKSTRKRIQGTKNQVLKHMKEATIIVMIAQMFLNFLRRGYIKLTDFCFIVLDECHHTAGNHPFFGIMKQFYFDLKEKGKKDPAIRLPVIMGLTASPLSQPETDPRKLQSNLNELCRNLDSTFSSYEQNDSLFGKTEIFIEPIIEVESKEQLPEIAEYFEKFKDHTTSLKKLQIHFPNYAACVQKVVNLISAADPCLKIDFPPSFITDPELFLFYDIKDCLLTKVRDVWLELGEYALCLAFNDMRRELLNAVNRMKTMERNQLLNQVLDVLTEHEKHFWTQYGQCVPTNLSGKINRLLEILSTTNIKSDKLETDMVLVFAFRRRTVVYLQKVLERYQDRCPAEAKQDFSSVAVTGYAGNTSTYQISRQRHTYSQDPSKVPNEATIAQYYSNFTNQKLDISDHKSQMQASFIEDRSPPQKMGRRLLEVQQRYANQMRKIIEFKQKKHRILITTSVTEEGFDIPGCNLVISFDTPFSLKSYIQIKGRARKVHSKYYIFTSKDREARMRSDQELYDDTINATYEIAIKGVNNLKSTIQKFQNDPDYQKITVKATGGLLNTNYALEVLKGFFSTLKPPNKAYYHFEQTTNIGCRCIICFPPSSPSQYSFVVGKMTRTKHDALKSAAFKAVIALKKEGFIRDDLLPLRLGELEDELEFQRYDDIGQCLKDPKYERIFLQNVHIRVSQVSGGKKIMCFYFKTLLPRQLQFPKISPSFERNLPLFSTVPFLFHAYSIAFSHMKTQNVKNEVGFLCCQKVTSFSQAFIDNPNQQFSVTYSSSIELKSYDYERLKSVHEFFIVATKSKEKQIEYYARLTNNPPVDPGWIHTTKAGEEVFCFDDTRKYFDLIVPLRQAANEFIIDWALVESIEEHIKLMRKLYVYHNRVSKYYTQGFPQNLWDLSASLKGQVNQSPQKVLLQAISKDIFLMKGVTAMAYPLSSELRNSLDKKDLKKLYGKDEKLGKMFIHARKEENVLVLKLQVWRNYLKSCMKDLLDKRHLLEEKKIGQTLRLLKEFVAFPISPQQLLKISISANFIYQVMQDQQKAIHFKEIYLKRLFESHQEFAFKVQPFKLHIRPSVILQHGKEIFGSLSREGRWRHLEIIGKSYQSEIPEFNDMSTINQNTINNDTFRFEDSQILGNISISNNTVVNNTLEMVEDSIDMKDRYDSAKALSKLEPTKLLKAMTSRMYKHSKVDNYEQLEFLGDVILKMLATFEVFLDRPTASESEMHIARVAIISNANLHRKAIRKRIFPYILASKRKIEPPPFRTCLAEKETPTKYKDTEIKQFNLHSEEDGFQYLPGKTHADVMEALIGIFYNSTHSLEDCQYLLYCFGILQKPSLKTMFQFPGNSSQRIPSLYFNLEQRINYHFREKKLLIQAFTDMSFRPNIEKVVDSRSMQATLNQLKSATAKMAFMEKGLEDKASSVSVCETFYERLEFLGDSVLDLVVVEYLLASDQKSEDKSDEGKLTALKQSVVCNKALALIALELGLEHLVLIDTEDVEKAMKSFAKVKSNLAYYKSETDKLADLNLTALKLLGDVLESLIGAIFLDTQMNYELTKEVIMGFMGKQIRHFSSPEYMKKSQSGRFQDFLKMNQYENCRVVKDPRGGMQNGLFKFLLVDSKGSTIFECFEASEKNAWEAFEEKQRATNPVIQF